MKFTFFHIIPGFLFLLFFSCQSNNELEKQNQITNLWHDIPMMNADGMVNMLIEIPAGSNEKYELNKQSGELEWEQLKNGEFRTINYLPYPANYGMIPQTYLPKNKGGDGDPLDIILLGPAKERGAIVSVRVIGVLQLTDRGENDDKLIAVETGSTFHNIESIEQLDSTYNGILNIIQTWFTNYKGKQMMSSEGYLSADSAISILKLSSEEYNQHFHIK